jgi:hypothetical protein
MFDPIELHVIWRKRAPFAPAVQLAYGFPSYRGNQPGPRSEKRIDRFFADTGDRTS